MREILTSLKQEVENQVEVEENEERETVKEYETEKQANGYDPHCVSHAFNDMEVLFCWNLLSPLNSLQCASPSLIFQFPLFSPLLSSSLLSFLANYLSHHPKFGTSRYGISLTSLPHLCNYFKNLLFTKHSEENHYSFHGRKSLKKGKEREDHIITEEEYREKKEKKCLDSSPLELCQLVRLFFPTEENVILELSDIFVLFCCENSCTTQEAMFSLLNSWPCNTSSAFSPSSSSFFSTNSSTHESASTSNIFSGSIDSHTDDADITFNVCIASSSDLVGGDLTFSLPKVVNSPKAIPVTVPQRSGHAVLHS
jgi:hypothetical protein